MPVARIVSGGQTGVDRAALDAALDADFPSGGWCPKGRRAEDGAIPGRYPLEECASTQYAARTRLNVRDSDATLVLVAGAPDGGTAKTIAFAVEMGRPHQVVDLRRPPDPQAVADWLAQNEVMTLNVAGPRESKSPGIHALARAYMGRLIAVFS